MQALKITLFLAFLLLLGVLALPVPYPKRVFRPEQIGMGYKDRVTPPARDFAPFPGKLFGGLVLDHTNTPRPDVPDKVEAVDEVDEVDSV